jgi:predicted nucleic acid-binding protein
MGAVVLDTSVVVALLDPADGLHQPAVRALRACRAAGQQLVLPACVLAEVMTRAGRVGDGATHTVQAFVDTIIDAVHDIDRRVAQDAAACQGRHPTLSLPAALVIAVGRVRGADAILTADPEWRRVDRRVKVVSHRTGGR